MSRNQVVKKAVSTKTVSKSGEKKPKLGLKLATKRVQTASHWMKKQGVKIQKVKPTEKESQEE